MTFNDLKFKKHKVTPRGVQATIEVKPNVFISVVAGPGLYSSPGGLEARASQFPEEVDLSFFSLFEVGIIDENLPKEEQQWEVIGWQSRDDINKLIQELSE